MLTRVGTWFPGPRLWGQVPYRAAEDLRSLWDQAEWGLWPAPWCAHHPVQAVAGAGLVWSPVRALQDWGWCLLSKSCQPLQVLWQTSGSAVDGWVPGLTPDRPRGARPAALFPASCRGQAGRTPVLGPWLLRQALGCAGLCTSCLATRSPNTGLGRFLLFIQTPVYLLQIGKCFGDGEVAGKEERSWGHGELVSRGQRGQSPALEITWFPVGPDREDRELYRNSCKADQRAGVPARLRSGDSAGTVLPAGRAPPELVTCGGTPALSLHGPRLGPRTGLAHTARDT